MISEAVYLGVRELQPSKKNTPQKVTEAMSETADQVRGLPLSASTSEPKKTLPTSFQQNWKWSAVRHWSIYRETPQVLLLFSTSEASIDTLKSIATAQSQIFFWR